MVWMRGLDIKFKGPHVILKETITIIFKRGVEFPKQCILFFINLCKFLFVQSILYLKQQLTIKYIRYYVGLYK